MKKMFKELVMGERFYFQREEYIKSRFPNNYTVNTLAGKLTGIRIRDGVCCWFFNDTLVLVNDEIFI